MLQQPTLRDVALFMYGRKIRTDRIAATIDNGDYCQYAESVLPSLAQ